MLRRTMSEEESAIPDLVELLRSAFDAANRRDVDALPRLNAPDAVLDVSRTLGVALEQLV